MADNKKDTKRLRREEAKQRRLEEIRRRQRKAQVRKYTAIGLVALALVGLVVGILAAQAASNRKKADLAAAAKSGGCTAVKTFPNEGSTHIDPPAKVDYKTDPPTSGNHYANTANTGFPSPTPPDENLVHNMEHGHVIIWYRPDLNTSIITALQGVVRKDPTRTILVVRENMDTKLAFTAWQHLQSCPSSSRLTPLVAQKFADLYKGKGPAGDRPQQPQGI